jgi:hypothetical protein
MNKQDVVIFSRPQKPAPLALFVGRRHFLTLPFLPMVNASKDGRLNPPSLPRASVTRGLGYHIWTLRAC